MSVHSEVFAQLEGQSGWQVDLALRLAGEVDENGTASAAKELRGLMAELAMLATASQPAKETGLSEFEKKLAKRQSAAPAARRAEG